MYVCVYARARVCVVCARIAQDKNMRRKEIQIRVKSEDEKGKRRGEENEEEEEEGKEDERNYS